MSTKKKPVETVESLRAENEKLKRVIDMSACAQERLLFKIGELAGGGGEEFAQRAPHIGAAQVDDPASRNDLFEFHRGSRSQARHGLVYFSQTRAPFFTS